MELNKISWTQQCNSCLGTGVYSGIAEISDVAIVCSSCKGTGKNDIVKSYISFTGKKEIKGISKVFAANPGIGIDHTVEGGASYKDWVKNPDIVQEAGREMRESTCPAWWYQSANNKLKPAWDECNESWGMRFEQCSLFPEKSNCWARWDKENDT